MTIIGRISLRWQTKGVLAKSLTACYQSLRCDADGPGGGELRLGLLWIIVTITIPPPVSIFGEICKAVLPILKATLPCHVWFSRIAVVFQLYNLMHIPQPSQSSLFQHSWHWTLDNCAMSGTLSFVTLFILYPYSNSNLHMHSNPSLDH